MVRLGMAGLLGALGLCGCGGGGGSDGSASTSAPAPVPVAVSYDTSTGKAPGPKYLAVSVESINPEILQFDIDGGYKFDDILVTVEYPNPVGGCSYKEVGASAACNVLAAGAALMLCDDTVSEGFGVALFKPDVQVASLGELVGVTMRGINCGAANAVRVGPKSMVIDASASNVVQHFSEDKIGGWYYNGTWLADAQKAAGFQYMDWQNRWIIYKIATPGYMNYYLLNVMASRVSNQKSTGQMFYYQKPV